MSRDLHLGRCGGIVLATLAVASCGGSSSSAVTPVTAMPTLSLASGPYTGSQSVTISDTTSGAVIHYTTDGTTPTTSSATYTAALPVSGSEVLQAIAIAPSHSVSQINGAIYTIGPQAAAAGIWVGSDSETKAAEVIGIVTPSGQSVFLIQNNAATGFGVFSGAASVTGTSFSVSLDGFTNFPSTYGTLYGTADTSSSGTGSLTATLGVRSSLVGALTFSSTGSSGATTYPSTWTLTYSDVSLTGSSLAAVAGSYTDSSTVADPNTGGTVVISATGVISSSGASSGCIMAGMIGTQDVTIDAYEVSYSYSACTGSWAVLNGVAFSGLAVLNGAANPAQLVMGVNGESGGVQYGLVTALNK